MTLIQHNEAIAGASRTANPFFSKSTLPFQLPPFHAITDAHFAEAFEEGMRIQRAEVDAIAADTTPVTADNTIIALERSGELLERTRAVFFNLVGCHTNAELDRLQRVFAPLLSAHGDAITLNDALFKRIEALHQARNDMGLDAETVRLAERYYTDFVRAGARLDDAQKIHLSAINSELATLSTVFGQNVLSETNSAALVTADVDHLRGLSADAIAAAAENASVNGAPGQYRIGLTSNTAQAVNTMLLDRNIRAQLQAASANRNSQGGAHDNQAIVLRTVTLRAQRARLLGYADHAGYVLADETAATPEAVNGLLSDLAQRALVSVNAESQAIQALINEQAEPFALAAHDWAHYAEQVRAQRYAFDASQLRPYLEMERVLQDGVFYAAHKLFGLSFVERFDLPMYHPDVRIFEVFENDGKSLALFLFDPYARPTKRGGAWMNSYVEQSHLLQRQPVIANHQNVEKPAAGQPTLLSFSEVITMFHEFGHGLHGMLSNVTYPRFSGTNVPRDFVEFPSQVYEIWATWPEVIRNYAKHYETGAGIPAELLAKMSACSAFNQGFATTEYLAAALLDQKWHQLTPENIPTDVLAFEAEALAAVGLNVGPVPPRYRSTFFSHIFAGGYSAGYYAYIWSEVLDADGEQWFQDNGGLTRENGERLRAHVLSRGGSADAMELYRACFGRDPSVAPLLARRGLTVA